MKKIVLAGAALATLSALPAYAQTGLEEAESTGIPSDWELSGNVGLFSEYRFRGIDFSDGDLALQGGIDLAHSSGFYVGTWASNLAGFGDFGGSHVEVDLYAGFGGDFGSVGVYDVGVLWYLYPGTDDTDYVELYGSVGADIAGAETTVGIAWAPDQANADDSLYLYGDVGFGIPNTPIALSAHLGYTDGFFGFGGLGTSGVSYDDNYIDYSIGASTDIYGLELGVAYVDTDIDEDREIDLGLAGPGVGSLIADDTVVVSIAYSF
ncbi:hypothetical protein B5C34_09360 [Pacificimonas flava]|uniref:Porin n=2 Tax=Pacificimonas TaxID=1960290 RepID=A0A219B6A5_9SPHN|nr:MULTISPECIES: TorF family putative porin [Pacificimonas]MBZ6379122.1 TorF family putative porin [Pacificimonas aurantium]OWV33646.1 hypothetical protein B5C34_09360 [Pacificimonas flava]